MLVQFGYFFLLYHNVWNKHFELLAIFWVKLDPESVITPKDRRTVEKQNLKSLCTWNAKSELGFILENIKQVFAEK